MKWLCENIFWAPRLNERQMVSADIEKWCCAFQWSTFLSLDKNDQRTLVIKVSLKHFLLMPNYYKESTHTHTHAQKRKHLNKTEFNNKQNSRETKVYLGIINKTGRVGPPFYTFCVWEFPFQLKFLFDLPDPYLGCSPGHLGICNEGQTIWITWRTQSLLTPNKRSPTPCFTSHTMNNCLLCTYLVSHIPTFVI